MILIYLFYIILLFWIISEVVLAKFQKSDHSNSVKDYDNNTLKRLWLTIIISLTVGIGISVSSIGYIYIWKYLSSLGLILIIFGLIIRWIAILTLKEYFTVDINVIRDQRVIKKGIYKFIRHPSYLGSLISFLGLSLVFSNIICIIIINVPIIIAFIHRIKIEEEVLIQNIGEEYIEYLKSTKKLLPLFY